MRFPQLPTGARFTYQGRRWVKVGPLTAADDSGAQRMLPRSALVEPLDPASAPAGGGTQLDRGRVWAAFDAFYGTCARLLAEEGQGGRSGESLRALEAARRRFLEDAGVPDGRGGQTGSQKR